MVRRYRRVNRKKVFSDFDEYDFRGYVWHRNIIGTLLLVRIMSSFMLLVTGFIWLLGDDVKKQLTFLFAVFIINELIVIIGRYDIFGRYDK